MKAIVVRDAQNTVVCFGPDNGSYSPGIPAGCTKQIEDDYKAVQNEYVATYVPPVDAITALQNKVTELEARLTLTEGKVDVLEIPVKG